MNATTETSDTDTDTDTGHLTPTARVAIRVPRSADATLVTAAEGRLDRADGVVGATIEAVHAVEPGLSATHVTVTATIELAASTASAGRAHLADTLGVDVLESDGRQEADST